MKLIGLVCLGLGAAAFVATAAGADASATAKSTAVTFKMVEWDILPTTSTKAVPGKVTFLLRNSGTLTHEFVVLRTAKAAGTLASSVLQKPPRPVRQARSARSSRARSSA